MTEIKVNAGGNLQTAINNAQPGDIVTIEAGASFRGPVELPAKTGDAVIVIQSSRASELPQGRVNSSHSALMPKIVAPNAEQAIRTKPGAHHYKLDGIEVLPEASVAAMYDLVRFGDGRTVQTVLSAVPHHLKIDRCYIHGLPTSSFQRGLSLNSSDTEVTRSCFAEIHGLGMDSQAICSWNTPGRNNIIDNYLEAASENILLGGSDPSSIDFIPSDYQILRNHVFKPLTYKGKGWAVKNGLELKNARNVVIDGNVFENNWTDGQSGIIILFTVRNQEGSAPYSIITNVKFTNNTVRNAEGAINLLGTDNEKPSQRCSGLLIENNIFDQINGHFLTINGYYDVTINRNTHLQSGNLTTFYSTPSTGFKYTNNLTIDHDYGIWTEAGIGVVGLQKFTPDGVWTNNVTANPYDKAAYPTGNQYPATLTLPADFRSPFAGIGCDIDALSAAQKGTVTSPVTEPAPTPTADPTPTPAPTPTPITSPDGTKATTITDGQGGVWSLGAQQQTLRNGTQMAGGFGLVYKWLGGVVYVLGTNSWWYKWTGSAWVSVSQTEPGTGPITRIVVWPKQSGPQNTLLDIQWKEQYRLRRIDGNAATFERVQSL